MISTRTNTAQLLTWSNQFDYVAYLTPNDFKGYPFGAFSHILAVGNGPSISDLTQLRSKISENKWLFGHFGYDLKNQLESLSSTHPDLIGFPDLSFFEPDIIIGFNNPNTPEIIKNLTTRTVLSEIEATICTTTPNQVGKIQARIEQEEYTSLFNNVMEHIRQGDIYEMNLCMEYFSENAQISAIETFLDLIEISPMPFSSFYKNESKYLISASPERFIKKTEDQITSQPMKGTNAASENVLINARLQQELRNSPKEQSENMMIVDLVRNDLAKSCVSGSVKVDELFGVYKLNKVNQMISTVSGIQKENIHALDILLNAFPMGSMTGAPKIEAMKLIEKYERTKRGLFSGSVGYFHPNGDFDFNVVIRSIFYDQATQNLSFQVGGAITYESKAEDEFNECLLKAASIKAVLKKYAIQN